MDVSTLDPGRRLTHAVALSIVSAGLCTCALNADAALTLNATGVADGFGLSTFYTDPGAYYGVIGNVGLPGNITIGSGYARGQIYKFNDVDGQSFGSAIQTAAAGGTPTDIATVSGVAYVGLLGGGYYKVNTATLALTPLSISGISAYYGLWGNETNGHLIAGTYQGLVDINPTTGTYTLVGSPGGNIDGVTVSPDGKVAYVEDNSSSIYGYSLVTPNPATPVFVDTGLPGGPDGTGIISGGTFDGDLIVDNNDGTVGLINHVTGAETIIASGGSRGDLVAPDPSNGTLFLSSADANYRLSCGKDCSIGSNPIPSIPEPSTFALLGLGVAATWLGSRRRGWRP